MKKRTAIIVIGILGALLLAAICTIIILLATRREPSCDCLDPSNNSTKYEKYMHPRDFSDTPPGFHDWPTAAQCSWQVKYFPDILDGYCGPFNGKEVEERDKGKTCDEMCQAIISKEKK